MELTLAHATRLKAIAAAKVKTDRVDSDLLAQLLRADLIPAAHRLARAARGPRDLFAAAGAVGGQAEQLPQQSRTRS